MKPAINVKNLGKEYKLGLVHTDLLSEKLGNGLRTIGNLIRPGNAISRARPQRNVSDSFWALKEIDFEVQPGEVMGVIGRNGAGKSTFLKILSRITSPTTGEVHLNGRVSSLLEVGTGFHPELTGRENIYLNGAILGMTRQEISRKFDEIVAFAEVEKFIDTPVKRYSSGMYVRLAFAVAAHLEPEILLVDEVLAVGDLAFQKKCLSKMEDVSGEGRTVLFVSHNMASVKRLCRSAMVLENGRINLIADAHEAVTAYYRNQQSCEPIVRFLPKQHRTNSEFQINFLAMGNQDEQPTRLVYADQPVRLRVGLEVAKPCGHVRVGVALYREGILISDMHTEPMDFPVCEKGSFLVCEIPRFLLLPGFYDVHVGAHSAQTGRGLDWIPDAFSFQVLDFGFDQDAHLDVRDRGVVRITPKWSLEGVDARKDK